LNESLVLPGEWSDLAGDPRVEYQVDAPLRGRLDPPHLLLLLHLHLVGLLDGLLGGVDLIHLGGDEPRLEGVALALLLMLVIDLLEQPLAVVDLKLVLEAVAELVGVLHPRHAVHEGVLQVLLGKGKALHLLEGLSLGLAFDSPLVERLVLLLDAGYLPLDLLLPLVTLVLEPRVAPVLEASDFVQLRLLLNLQKGLLYSLGQEYVKDGLDFSIVVKEVVIFNLGHLVDPCLLGDVGWGWWSGQELICLNSTLDLICLILPLLS